MVGSGKLYSLTDQEFHSINTLLMSNSLTSIRFTTARIFDKAFVNGQQMFSKEYKGVTKCNSYTISYCVSNNTLFGTIQKFILIEGYHLAVLKTLHIKTHGPPHVFSESVVTRKTSEVLFSDYISFETGGLCYVLAKCIKQKCCNLSNNVCNLLTTPVNNIERE